MSQIKKKEDRDLKLQIIVDPLNELNKQKMEPIKQPESKQEIKSIKQENIKEEEEMKFIKREAPGTPPLVSGEISGKGHMIVSDKPFQYVYWDNINELVHRLRLLIASQNAGNTSHNNEIMSIIEELREAGVVE
ncbi:hypothetical protein QE152_g1137 [Popillia japonica]|uniref:Uncharacterized protein n=1 Tax=Popillia japonica TaxID=7064 RepID=A0AAW1N3V6_POPJA